MQKFVDAAGVQYSGPLLQISGWSFIGIGEVFNLNNVAIALGILFSFFGFLLSFRSYRIQTRTNELQTQQAQLEIERTKLELEVLKNANPDISSNIENGKSRKRTKSQG